LNIEQALDEALRVGRRVIVGVPNFCQWRARLQVFFQGEMPVTDRLPFKSFYGL
ncbi:MAG: methionine biosynthesis protein MetW, partial [Nitrospirae bacterium]|nr:methionine biosynthesis protein MetW [Nitrospirota bacterium]